MVELIKGIEVTSLKLLGVCSIMLTLCSKFPLVPFCSRFERFLLAMKALGSQVDSSPDIAELLIRLMAKDFRFKVRGMRLIRFLEFLALGFLNLFLD